MDQRMSNILTGVLVIGIALLAALGPAYIPHFGKLHKLFDSQLNIFLMAVLVLFITLFNIKIGIAFAFMVLMFAVYMRDDAVRKSIEGFFTDLDTSASYTVGKQEYANPKSASVKILSPIDEMTYAASDTAARQAQGITEGFVAAGAGAAASTLASTQAITQPTENINLNINNPTAMNSAKPIIDHVNGYLNAANKKPACVGSTQYEYLTQKADGDKNINGYDVVGCRYDLESRPQNFTTYGPPLAWCATYDQSQAKRCGTLFYPLNG